MFSFKIQKPGKECRLINRLRSLLLMWLLLLVVLAEEAQTYDWKPVKIHGGGFVTGILFHPMEKGAWSARRASDGMPRIPIGVSQVIPLDASGLSERVAWSIPTTEPNLFLRLK
jgi:hypothetical protein